MSTTLPPHPARALLEAAEKTRDATREAAEEQYRAACRAALQLALGETGGDLRAAASLLGVGYRTAGRWLEGSPDLRGWLDSTYPERQGARREEDGSPRISSRNDRGAGS
jgi:hypothetical protein